MSFDTLPIDGDNAHGDKLRREVVVVGGGQAGLAMGYYLKRMGTDFVILEAADQLAAAWRGRWDSLQLFTPARYSNLPGLAFPGDGDRYPGRDDVVDYLEDYARRFDLPVELNSHVDGVRRENGAYALNVGARSYVARQVVIATGPFQVPFVPAIATRLSSSVVQLHSSEYRRPADVPQGRVVVVGGGNTGFQIAKELAKSHEVHLSIGSRQLPLPSRVLGRDLFWYLETAGLMSKTRTSRLGRRMQGRETLIGSRPGTLRRRFGVKLHDRAVDAVCESLRFADGGAVAVSAIIWATGFRVDHSRIDVPVFDEHGRALHERGVTPSPGLYFLGLSWLHTRGSSLIGWVKDDARFLADRIADFDRMHSAPTAPAPWTA